MNAWSFTVLHAPKAQPRTKATSFGGKARVWTPSTADGFKTATSLAALAAVDPGVTPIRDPVELAVAFYLPRPKRLCRKSDPRGAIRCASKPDIDNLLKALLDALVNAGVLDDDAQLWCVSMLKFYAEIDGAPRAEVRLEISNTDNHD